MGLNYRPPYKLPITVCCPNFSEISLFQKSRTATAGERAAESFISIYPCRDNCVVRTIFFTQTQPRRKFRMYVCRKIVKFFRNRMCLKLIIHPYRNNSPAINNKTKMLKLGIRISTKQSIGDFSYFLERNFQFLNLIISLKV